MCDSYTERKKIFDVTDTRKSFFENSAYFNSFEIYLSRILVPNIKYNSKIFILKFAFWRTNFKELLLGEATGDFDCFSYTISFF